MNKYFLTLCVFLCLSGSVLAQVPQAFQYQAVARNSNGKLISDQDIGVKISIANDPLNPTFIYAEEHTSKTNHYGLFSLEIGTGDPIGSALFSDINWANGNWYLTVAVDSTGGTSYTDIGEVKIISVPYSLYAEKAGSLSGPTDITLGDLTDVSTQGVSNEKVLKYDGTTWVAGNDLKDDADADPTNEIQTLSISGSDLAISSGNSVTIPGVPSGTMMMFCGPSANIPAGWLECDGASYIKSQYPELSAAIGIAWGGTGSTFNVPDMRGRFARGLDDGQGRDPDVTSRSASNSGGNTGDAVGSAQDDAFQGHFHGIQVMSGTGGGSNNWVAKGGGPAIPSFPIEAPTTMSIAGGGNLGVPRVAAETRPQNVNVIYIIKE